MGRKTIEKKCDYCNTIFEAVLSEVKRGNAKYCSKQCSFDSRIKTLYKIKCEECDKHFESSRKESKFCSHSCSATINNSLMVSKIKLFKCKNCNVETKVRKNGGGVFCSHICHRKYEYDYNIKLWKDGKLKGYKGKTKAISNWLRKYMLEKTNNTCQKCGWNNRHPIDDKPLVEINHIDGNAENNCEDNLEVLCPNCHSMTHNFKSRNKNSARNRK